LMENIYNNLISLSYQILLYINHLINVLKSFLTEKGIKKKKKIGSHF
jgi:hypothetical protein